MSLKLRVRGNSRIDADEVRRALAVLADPQHGIQLQVAPYWAFKTFAGADIDGAIAWLKEQTPTGVYYALNPVAPGLSSRVVNADPTCRRWLLVDVDRNKTLEPDASATEAEHEAARALAVRVMDHLTTLGWPTPVLVDSGNGFHLLYRVDLPNDAHAKALVRAALHRLAEDFDGADGGIGKECHDARRIAKLPGTLSQRGEASQERPHRMCKLLYVPEEIEIVTADMLQAAGQKADTPVIVDKPHEANGHTKDAHLVLRTSGDDGRAYARAALRAECARVALATPGTKNGEGRNNILFKASANMGELVAGGCILRQEVEAALEEAARACGLDADPGCGERGIRATIRSGLDTGAKQPRGVPEKKSSLPKEPSPTTLERLTIRASEIEPKAVDWLVRNRIPKRFITVLAGRTGIGKSFVACDLIARLTTGREVPGGEGELFQVGNALLISEDPYEYVLVPRLMELGYDRQRVSFMTWDAMASYTLNDIGTLDRAWEEAGRPTFVGIDPPTNFLGDTDEHKNSEVRVVLKRISAWLVERDVAVVLITHVNKNTGKGVDAISRVMGSIAWMTSARIGHAFVQDPDDKERCLWVPLKTNLGPLGKGLAYRIRKTDALATVEWLGEVDTTADEAMAGEKGVPRRVVASQWLIERFREKREWASEDLFRAAGQEGISRNAVFEAKNSLNLPRARRNVGSDGSVAFSWWVPDNWEHLQLTQEEVAL